MARPSQWKADFNHISGIVGKLNVPQMFDLLGRLAKYPLPRSHWNYAGTLGLDNEMSSDELLRRAVLEFQRTTAEIILRQSTMNNRLRNCVGYSRASNIELRRRRIKKLATLFEAGVRAQLANHDKEITSINKFLDAVSRTCLISNN